MTSYLLLGQSVYAHTIPDAQAVVIEHDEIVWIGSRAAAKAFELDVDFVVDVPDSFIAPAFVDAHVHLTDTGLQSITLDLSVAASFSDLALLVNNVDARNLMVIGHGWDDSNWTDTFSDFLEFFRSGRKSIYLTRIDAHSAIAFDKGEQSEPQIVSGIEHERFRKKILTTFSHQDRYGFIQSALQTAASNGIASVHENAGPAISSLNDLSQCIELGKQVTAPEVIGYWGDADFGSAIGLGAFGAAGDYSIDGSLGSHTAFLLEEYSDLIGSRGNEYLTQYEVARHLVACTKSGIQAGFHVIGDAGIANLISGIQLALEQVSLKDLRACRHRVEHLEMVSPTQIELLAEAGFTASVQPMFDSRWGKPGAMYEKRLGRERASTMNPFAKMLDLGLNVAFGSDAPVTPMNPWLAIRAAMNHNQIDSRITARAAFSAHTRGGYRAAKNDRAGVVEVGAVANLAIWNVEVFSPIGSDDRKSRWSTDTRSGVHPLPDLSHELPKCIATLKNGLPIYDPENFWKSLV